MDHLHPERENRGRRMSFDAAGDERDLARDEQRAGAVLHHLAGALERGDAVLECALLARADAQLLRELAHAERLARSLQLAQDLARIVVVDGYVRALGSSAAAQGCSFGFLGQALGIFG